MPLDVDALISVKASMTFSLRRFVSAPRASSRILFVLAVVVAVFVKFSWLKAVRWALFICIDVLGAVESLVSVKLKATVREAVVDVALWLKFLFIRRLSLPETLIVWLVALLLKA